MKRLLVLSVFLICVFVINVFAGDGVYLGIQTGISSQRPDLRDFEFNRDTTFLFGARLGVRFFLLGLEVNYFLAAHDLDPKDIGSFLWGKRKVDYHHIGFNLKFVLPVKVLNPYLTVGYGYYTADIFEIDRDTDGG